MYVIDDWSLFIPSIYLACVMWINKLSDWKFSFWCMQALVALSFVVSGKFLIWHDMMSLGQKLQIFIQRKNWDVDMDSPILIIETRNNVFPFINLWWHFTSTLHITTLYFPFFKYYLSYCTFKNHPIIGLLYLRKSTQVGHGSKVGLYFDESCLPRLGIFLKV